MKERPKEERQVVSSPLVMLSDAAIRVEKIRVGAKVRLSHLERRGKYCPETEEFLRRSQALEEWVDGRLSQMIKAHPAYPWFSRILGIGGENIGKVLGLIESFGRFYDVGDPWIPSYVRREPVLNDAEEGPKLQVWVEAIERLTTPSKLRKLCGRAPGQEREVGQRLSYIAPLKTMCWRLEVCLLRAKGKLYGEYLAYKDYLTNRLNGDGVKILPTPKVRRCLACDIEVKAKSARLCPQCGGLLTLKKEPDGVIWEGHVHMMAQRRMGQLFLNNLWHVWREALGLPVMIPYPVEHGGHSRIISPWDVVDR